MEGALVQSIRRSALVLLVVFGALPALAAAPGKVTVQGLLRSDTGAPQDGTFAIKVQIFPDETSTTPLLDETSPAVSVASGVFSIEVGGSTPTLAQGLAAATDPQVQITVNDVVLPKQPLTSAAYALHTKTVPYTGVIGRPTPACPDGGFLNALNGDGTSSCGAAVTQVVAGDGLTGGTVTGAGTVAVAFAGSGAATTVARSDHSHPMSCGSRSANNASGTAVSVSCDFATETLTGGGCAAGGGGVVVNSYPSHLNCSGFGCFCLFGGRCFVDSWSCTVNTGTVSAYAVCCNNPVK